MIVVVKGKLIYVDPKVLKRAMWAAIMILALLLWFVLTLLGYAPSLPISLAMP